jgi:hypothetical protein
MSGPLLNPDPCNNVLLADQTALASQVQNPLPPFPVFFNGGQCGGGGAPSASSFPLYYFPSDCSFTTIPTPINNCLRVINDPDFDPFHGPAIDPQFMNVLPGGTDQLGNPANNVFTDPNSRLYSFYCPPQYEMVFYHLNPMTNTREIATAAGYLHFTGNQLMVDACLSDARLNNGLRFLNYNNDPNFTPPCLEAYCNCGKVDGQGNPQIFDAGPSYCLSPNQASVPCPGVSHNAPYFIVIQRQDYSDIIREMCVNNRKVDLGPDAPDNSLNRVWKAQAFGCDTFITNLCTVSDITQSEYAEMCSCYTQQQALNNQYGTSLDVPVCCFGQDPSGDIKKSCAFNSEAYKTNAMLQNCCSFAECQTVVNDSPGMQAQASPPGEINCQGNFVQFPVPPVTVTVLPSVIVTDTSSIPIYVWIVLVIAILLLLLFVVILSFV